MSIEDTKLSEKVEQDVTWSSQKRMRSSKDRRNGVERRHMSGRAITVPDMRSGEERRSGKERRKVKLVITGRAIDI